MRFLCRIGWHDWGKWSALKVTEGGAPVQSLECKYCGRIKVVVW